MGSGSYVLAAHDQRYTPLPLAILIVLWYNGAMNNTCNAQWVYNDGGRSEYFKGSTGDCVTRAIAIAAAMDYKKVYDDLYQMSVEFGKGRSRKAKETASNPSPRMGVPREVYQPYLTEPEYGLCFDWVPMMSIGSGCQYHLSGDLGSVLERDQWAVARCSGHLVAVHRDWDDEISVFDTYDSTRRGTRCVYGLYIQS